MGIMLSQFIDHCKDPEKPRVFLLRTIGISALSICVTTIHSGLGSKSGKKSTWFK